MQSTGQTSTQERSFTVMQGSAMTYGMPSPEKARFPGAWRRGEAKHRNDPSPVKGRGLGARRHGLVPTGTGMRVIADNTTTSPAYCHSAVRSGVSAGCPCHAAY